MPKGEPTKVVRLPVWLLDHLESLTKEGETVPELITRRLAPRDSPVGPVVSDGNGGSIAQPRCQCATPTLSKVVTNICTTCHRLR